MSTPITFNNVAYSVPSYNDTGYAQGAGNLSSYLVAISTGTLQQAGGTFSLTADVNFGSNFGLISKYYTSVSANAASAGVIRLANTDLVEWRNFANGGNNTLGVDSSDQLVYNGAVIPTGGSTVVTSITGTAHQVIASASTGAVTLSTPQNIDTTSSPTFAGLTLSSPLTVPNGGTGQASYTNGQLLIGNTTGNTLTKSTLTGTTNQVNVSNGTGSITLSTPQDINTSSDVTFHKLTINQSAGQTGIALVNGSNIVGIGAFSVVSNSALGLGGTDILLSAPTYPGSDNFYAFGKSSNRWTNVHSLGYTIYGGTSGNIAFSTPGTVTSYSLVWPNTQSVGTTFLQNDGSGNLSWVSSSGSGTVTSGTAGNMTLYNASTNTVTDTYVQNTKNITVNIATQGSRSANLVYTIPNPGNAATTATFSLLELAQTYSAAKTFSAGITMSGSTIAMGSNKITGLAAGSTAGDALRYEQLFTSSTVTLLGSLAFNPTTAGIVGTTTNDNPPSGNVGEVIESVVSAAANFTASTGAYQDVTSITLTAGDWMVTAGVDFKLNGATITYCEAGIGTTTGNSGAGLVVGDNDFSTLPPTSAVDTSICIPPKRFSLSGSTTKYLKISIAYSAGTPQYRGRITAWRIR